MFENRKSFLTQLAKLPGPDDGAIAKARARQQQLTKPPGSLGRLEELACWLAGWQGIERPVIRRVQVVVFAGNHGVTARGVSPYPAEVTRQMVANFKAGGAAINAICGTLGHELSVTALDLERPTKDFTIEPAMNEAGCLAALNAGANSVDDTAGLIVPGDMGIGNSTVASALAAARFGGSGVGWAGPGTGHDSGGVALKARVVDEAVALHGRHSNDSFELLRRLGGREVAAIAGAIVAARIKKIPVVLDGFIVTAAAAALTLDVPGALDHCVAGHVSAEPAHKRMLEELGLSPLLDLGMRLGEGTGGALAAALLIAAAATHSGMATFAESGVSDRED